MATIAENLTKLSAHIEDAYSSISNMGGTIPEKHNATNLSSSIATIPTGGGMDLLSGVEFVKKQFYVVFRAVGNEVARWKIEDAASKTTLPDIPDAEYLTKDEWNWTLAEIQDYIATQTINSDIDIDATYHTTDGKTYLFIDIPYGGRTSLSVVMKCSVVGGLEIEWGDGATTSNTTTSTTTYKHTYASTGQHIIKLNCTSGTLTLGGGSYSNLLMGTTTNSASSPGRANISALKKIYIGKGMTSCGNYSTYNTIGLEMVILPKTVTTDGWYQFASSYRLRYVSASRNLKSYGTNPFGSCYSMRSYTFTNALTAVPANAFTAAYCIHNVTIPKTCKSIGMYAFQNNYALSRITVPPSITSFGAASWQNTYSLQSNPFTHGYELNVSATNYAADYVKYKTAGNIELSGYTAVPSYAFGDCYCLESIKLPANVKAIGSYAFYNDYSLQSFTAPSSLTAVGSYCFYCNYSLSSADFSQCSSMTSIPDRAFYYCVSLDHINVPPNLRTIGTYAFQYCYCLLSIDLPGSLTTIGQQAFTACANLRSISIPSSVTSIGTNAFQNDTSLQYVKFSANVTAMPNAFGGCYGVKTYDLSEMTKVPTLANVSYLQTNNDTQIIVPDSLYDTWIAATNWTTLSSHIVKASEATIL